MTFQALKGWDGSLLLLLPPLLRMVLDGLDVEQKCGKKIRGKLMQKSFLLLTESNTLEEKKRF
jgi:hypothetical protein